MKHTIILLLIAFSFNAQAQNATPQGGATQLTYQLGWYTVDSGFAIPIRDTLSWKTFTSRTPATRGRMTFRPQDSTIYFHNGKKWIAIGGASGGVNYWSPGTAQSISNNNTGFVGIGTIAPTQKLHVKDGNFLVDNGRVTVKDTTAEPPQIELRNSGDRSIIYSPYSGGGPKRNFVISDEDFGNRYEFHSSQPIPVILHNDSLTDGRDYQWPNASGTIALVTDIPSNQNLQSVTSVGNATTNQIISTGSDAPPITDAAVIRFDVDNARAYFEYGSGGGPTSGLYLDADGVTEFNTKKLHRVISTLTTDRTHTEPNKDGTYALLDDIPSLSGYVQNTRTISTTAPLTGGGDLSANRTLSIAASTNSVDGYLTAADHTTFNNKQAALVSGTNIKTVNGSSLLGSGNVVIYPDSTQYSTIYRNDTGNANLRTAIANAGTVTSASVVSANGFAGSVATATTTPAITLSTTVTGMVKGNGTALSAAVANTDYLRVSNPIFTGTILGGSFSGTGASIVSTGTSTSAVDITANSLTSAQALTIGINGTAAQNGQAGIQISLQGTNAGANLSTYAGVLLNQHQGTGAINNGLFIQAANGATNYALVTNGGRVGFGTITPTAMVHITSGTATANTAPLKFTSGTLLTTPEAATFEYLSNILYWTPNATRMRVMVADNTTPATTTIPVGDGTSGYVNTTATGTGAPVRAGSPTFTGVATTIPVITYTTQSTPADPASGSSVQWFDGTNMKYKKNVGGTVTSGTIY